MGSHALSEAAFAGGGQNGRLIRLDTLLGDDWLLPLYAKGRAWAATTSSSSMLRRSDWNFVHRSLEEAGVFGRFEQGEDGESHALVLNAATAIGRRGACR